MLKKLLLLLTIAFSCIFCFGQAPQEKSILWVVTGKNLPHPSYIFGTIHAICPQDYFWTRSMDSCFKKTSTLCLEIKMDNPGLNQELLQGLMLPKGKQLRDFMSDSDYVFLKNYLSKNAGLTDDSYNGLRPFALISFLVSEESACDAPTAYELKLTALAKKRQHPILGLETVQEQISVLKSIPDSEMAQNIIASIKDSTQSEQNEYNHLLQAYKQQNLALLGDLINQSETMKLDLNTFLFDRNAKWIPKMEAQMRKKSTFFAVGAGHLTGEKGIIALLRKQGFKVKPVF